MNSELRWFPIKLFITDLEVCHLFYSVLLITHANCSSFVRLLIRDSFDKVCMQFNIADLWKFLCSAFLMEMIKFELIQAS